MSKQVMQRALDALLLTDYYEQEAAITELRAAIDAPEVGPVAFLADATRFKVRGDEDSEACRIYGIPHELNGRWVALVAADDNCHLKLTTPPDTEALRRDAERLQHLCNSVRCASANIDGKHGWNFLHGHGWTTGATFREAIDAAIAAQGATP